MYDQYGTANENQIPFQGGNPFGGGNPFVAARTPTPPAAEAIPSAALAVEASIGPTSWKAWRNGEGAFGTNWDFGGGARQAQPEKGADKKVTLTVSFDEAFNGAEKKVRVVNPETQEKETLTIKVPAGAMEGGRVRMKGKGHPGANGGAAGDLLVTIKIAPDAELQPQRGRRYHQTAGEHRRSRTGCADRSAHTFRQESARARSGRNAGRRSAHAERSRCTTSRQERFGNGRLESRDRGQDPHHP